MRKSYDELIRRIANHTDSDFRWVEQKFTEMIDFISNRDELFAQLKYQKERIEQLEQAINSVRGDIHIINAGQGGQW